MSFDEDIFDSEVELPLREFLFRVDQVCAILDVSVTYARDNLLYFQGRDIGRNRDKIRTINIAPADAKPLWRIPESDFKAWMKMKGIRFTEPKPTILKRRKPR